MEDKANTETPIFDSVCLRCGKHHDNSLVEGAVGLRLKKRVCDCGGQIVSNPRRNG